MRVVSVNVGRPRQVSVRHGRPVMSAIGKAPVDHRVRVAGANVDGDDQADRRVHGGAGDEVDITHRPSHGVTIGLVARAILFDDSLLARAAAAPELPANLAAWMREHAA